MAQNEQFQNPSRDKRGARDGQGGQEARRSSARGDFQGRDSRKSGPSGRGASRGNGASCGNGGSRGERGFRGNDRPHNDWESRGDGASRGARGDIELAATEPAFEPLPAQYPLMVGNIDGGRKVEVLCRDKGADQFAARLRKVASSAFLYKKLLSARWWHISNPLEQANRLATQFLRIALFCYWNFLQK